MTSEHLKLNIDVDDGDFNKIYPDKIRKLAKKHWTPVPVARLVTEFLVEKDGTKVLDIGSGAGKFCMIGAVHTNGLFTGVEQRADLVRISNKISKLYDLRNVNFIHSNITAIDFRSYDAFYFYNSFYENIAIHNKIDDSISTDMGLYHSYSMYLFEQLCCLPIGTRLATYHTSEKIIPMSYQLQFKSSNHLLKFWVKIDK